MVTNSSNTRLTCSGSAAARTSINWLLAPYKKINTEEPSYILYPTESHVQLLSNQKISLPFLACTQKPPQCFWIGKFYYLSSGKLKHYKYKYDLCLVSVINKIMEKISQAFLKRRTIRYLRGSLEFLSPQEILFSAHDVAVFFSCHSMAEFVCLCLWLFVLHEFFFQA